MNSEELFQILINNFSQEELNSLYFELGLDYRNRLSLSKRESASNLLKLVHESGHFSQLLAMIKQQRPYLFIADQAQTTSGTATASSPTSQDILEMDRMALYNFLISHFDFAQIRTACSELGVAETQLSGTGKAAKVRELIIYLEDTNRLSDLHERLVQHLSGKYPLEESGVAKGNPFMNEKPTSAHAAQSSTLNSLADQIAHHLHPSELKTACFDLGIDYDDLPGANDFQRIESLISIFTNQKQIGHLLGYLNREYPSVSWRQEF